MSIPSSVLAAGWIPFVVVIVLVVIFSVFYIKYYMSKTESEWSTTISAVFALTVTLLTTALIPVDVFLVSFMKTSDGAFKDWAVLNSTRNGLEESVLIGYYVLYGLITFCLFLLLPFMYFFYEEREEDASCKSRCCGALKFTVVFLILMAVLLLIGALVHTKPVPTGNKNMTDWQKLEALFDMESNWIENSLSLVISVLSLIGMITLFVYTLLAIFCGCTAWFVWDLVGNPEDRFSQNEAQILQAYGMAALPIGLIKGHRNVRNERLQITDKKSETTAKIAAIRNKYSTNRRNMSTRDASRISDLEESEALMERQERHLAAKDTCCQRCLVIMRPFQIVFGICFILLALLVFISLLLTNIDKAIHSAGAKQGYALAKRSLPNPVDIVLVFSQKVFPLDYVLFSALVFYLLFCSMSGLRNIGIWFFWLRMYRIRPQRTRPQALLMLCFILSFIMLAINIIVYELTPQYSSYGSQHYQTHENKTEVCSLGQSNDDCVLTRMSLLLTRFFYKMWFFGAAYYWGTWAFLFFILLGFVIAIFKKRKSSIDGEVDPDDIVDSDEEMLSA